MGKDENLIMRFLEKSFNFFFSLSLFHKNALFKKLQMIHERERESPCEFLVFVKVFSLKPFETKFIN